MEKQKNDENEVKTTRVSSAFTRVVGNSRLEVYNTKQTPGLPKKAYQHKWAVLKIIGKRQSVIGTHAKKHPMIQLLRDTEIELKAKKE